MKKMTIIPVVAVTLLVGGIVNAAQPTDATMENKPAVQQQEKKEFTEAQREAARIVREQAQMRMQPLHQAMFVKQQELRALHNAATPDVNAVSQKAMEINEIRSQMDQERKNAGLALDIALGLKPGTHSMRGMHGGDKGFFGKRDKDCGGKRGMGHDRHERDRGHGYGREDGHRGNGYGRGHNNQYHGM